jgi:hypothetical protein
VGRDVVVKTCIERERRQQIVDAISIYVKGNEERTCAKCPGGWEP